MVSPRKFINWWSTNGQTSRSGRSTLAEEGHFSLSVEGGADQERSYRLHIDCCVCLKLPEKHIRNRLAEANRAARDLSQGSSGSDQEIHDGCCCGGRGCRSRRIRLLINLDPEIVFNSIRWTDIFATLEDSFHVPNYLFLQRCGRKSSLCYLFPLYT